MFISTLNSRFESVNQMVWEMCEVIKFVKLSIKSAQDRSEHYVDKKMNFWEFEVGDKVFFWRSHLKDLARHWESQSYLPYFVVSWILLGGLDRLFVNWTCTSIGSYIMIIHVSLLSKHVSNPNHVFPELPNVAHGGNMLGELDRPLSHRVKSLLVSNG